MSATTIDMDVVRDMHRKGFTLKQIAFFLGVAYNTVANRTAAAGIRFRNNPHKTLRPKQPPKQPPAPPPESDAFAVIRSDRERTRRILDLCVEREHAPHWEKPVITRKIEALRA